VYRQEIKGDVQAGERLFTRISHDVSGRDPRTARVLEASFERLQSWDGTEPAAVVAVPDKPSPPGVN
jgi:hypothetical protein